MSITYKIHHSDQYISHVWLVATIDTRKQAARSSLLAAASITHNITSNNLTIEPTTGGTRTRR